MWGLGLGSDRFKRLRYVGSEGVEEILEPPSLFGIMPATRVVLAGGAAKNRGRIN